MTENDFYFDERAAQRVCKFFPRYLVHSRDQWAGKPFELLDWQEHRVLRPAFGWKRKADDRRRYRRIYCEIAKGNGKSPLGSGVALYLTTADGVPGAEVYGLAGATDQAQIVFGEAKGMVLASERLSAIATPYRNSIVVPSTQSAYRVLSADADLQHGYRPSGLVFDEFHVLKSRDLWDVMTCGMMKRENPICFAFTTAGYDQLSICYELHEHALKVLDDPMYDPEFLPVIFAAEPQAPIDAEATWRQANPALGELIRIEDMAKEADRAKREPSYENTFRRLHLCQWTEQATRWLQLEKWDACVAPAPIDLAALAGELCFGGLDLSQTYDLSAWLKIFPRPGNVWLIVPRLYCPRETAARRQRDEGTPYLEWIQNGDVIATEGATIDYDRVEKDLLADASQYEIRELAFDPYNANAMVSRLEQAGVTTVPVYQSFLELSVACKEVERRLVTGPVQIQIAPNACLRWMASNVEIESDKHGNIRPVKPRMKGKYGGTAKLHIDGIVAMIIAAKRAMLNAAPAEEPMPGLAWA